MMSLCGLLLHHRFTAWVIDLYILCWDLHGACNRSWQHFLQMGSELVPEELWMTFCMFYCSARVPRVFRGCCAAVGAIIRCPTLPPGPSTQNGSIVAHNIDFHILWWDLRGCIQADKGWVPGAQSSKKTMDRRGRIKKGVPRRCPRCPRGCPRRSARVFRAHRNTEESKRKSKIVVFWGYVKKVSAEVSVAIS